MFRGKSITLILAAIALGAGAFLYPSNKQNAVSSAAVKHAAPTGVIAAAGRTEPLSEEVRVASEIDGKLKAIFVEEGQSVKRGQAIATLENADYAARVELARATLRERQAAFDRLVHGARSFERREAKALVDEADAVLENARVELERRRTLLARGAVSRMEFATAEREERVARARKQAALERRALIDADARQDERMRAEAEVDRARAMLAESQALLAKTVIRAPIDGIVLRKRLKVGESAPGDGSTPVVTLGDCSQLRVRVDVDEIDVARLRVGQRAWVTAGAYGDRRFPGRVMRIGGILGRKNVRTDEPSERVDTKILETLVELDPGTKLPLGLRVDAFIEAGGQS
jgi:ABC exporter DevB family membrane fusion protein